MNACRNPRCLGNYDFHRIAHYARLRFVEGFTTMQLLQMCKTNIEREEVALVSLLDIEDSIIQELELSCRFENACTTKNCRELLKKMIQEDLEKRSAVQATC